MYVNINVLIFTVTVYIATFHMTAESCGVIWIYFHWQKQTFY